MAGLKVFFDSFSQPSRAVLILLGANKIKYDPCLINVAKGMLHPGMAACTDDHVIA